MRRALAVLALLATSWPHVVVLECALGSTSATGMETTQPSAAAEAALLHGAGGASHHPAPHEHHGSDSAVGHADGPTGLQCAMVMACGLVMIRSEGGGTLAGSGTAPGTDSARALDPPGGADLGSDPPPPRRSA